MDKKRTVSYLILGIERTCKRKMCILSAEKFFEIELCQRTRISLIKLYDKYLPFCNFYALVSHAIFFSRKTRTRKSQKKCLKFGNASRSRRTQLRTVLKDADELDAADHEDILLFDWDERPTKFVHGGLTSNK